MADTTWSEFYALTGCRPPCTRHEYRLEQEADPTEQEQRGLVRLLFVMTNAGRYEVGLN